MVPLDYDAPDIVCLGAGTHILGWGKVATERYYNAVINFLKAKEYLDGNGKYTGKEAS